jgi:hypothetical protein
MLFGVATARATTFTYNAIVDPDPTQAIVLNSGGLLGLSTAVPYADFLVAVGDVFTGTITFADGPVQLSGPEGSIAQALLEFSDVGSDFEVSYVEAISVLGLAGSLSKPVFTGSGEGTGVFASMQAFGPAYDFSFSQFDYTVTVTGINSPNAPPTQGVFAAYFDIYANGIRLGSVAPEPETVGLCAAGCAAILGAARFRSRTGS